MLDTKEIALINREELVETIKRRFAGDIHEIIEEIYAQPIIAVAIPHYEIKPYQ